MAAEIWFYIGCVLRYHALRRKSNEEVLKEAEVQRTMIKRISQRQLAFLNHVMRRHGVENLVVN